MLPPVPQWCTVMDFHPLTQCVALKDDKSRDMAALYWDVQRRMVHIPPTSCYWKSRRRSGIVSEPEKVFEAYHEVYVNPFNMFHMNYYITPIQHNTHINLSLCPCVIHHGILFKCYMSNTFNIESYIVAHSFNSYSDKSLDISAYQLALLKLRNFSKRGHMHL